MAGAIFANYARVLMPGVLYVAEKIRKKSSMPRWSISPTSFAVLPSLMAELFDQDGRLQRIQDLPPHMRAAVASVETVRGGGLKVKLWNKNNALDSLGRWHRMFVELQERGKVGEFDHQTDDEVRADIEMLRAITKAKGSAKESSES